LSDDGRNKERETLADRDLNVLYDGGTYPEYERARERGLKLGKLVVLVGMIGTPIVIAIVLVMLWTMPGGELDLPFITAVFVAVVLADEPLMYFIVGPSVRRRWMFPPVVTDKEFRFGSHSMLLAEIESIEVFDGALNIQWKTDPSKHSRYVMFTNDELGSGEDFLKAVTSRNAGIQVEDLRKKRST
jgi:hypothetical protein